MRTETGQRKPGNHFLRRRQYTIRTQPSVLYFILWILLFALCVPVLAQQSDHVPKIGFLGVRPDDSKDTFELLKRELRTLGYIDGKTATLLYRNAENKLERLPALADELVRLKVDVLVVAATNEARAAKNATKTIPIVGLNVGNSIGLIDSLSHPGGNLTGFSPNATNWAANVWNCSKKPFPASSGSRSYGTQMLRPAKLLGRKSNRRLARSDCKPTLCE